MFHWYRVENNNKIDWITKMFFSHSLLAGDVKPLYRYMLYVYRLCFNCIPIFRTLWFILYYAGLTINSLLHFHKFKLALNFFLYQARGIPEGPRDLSDAETRRFPELFKHHAGITKWSNDVHNNWYAQKCQTGPFPITRG